MFRGRVTEYERILVKYRHGGYGLQSNEGWFYNVLGRNLEMVPNCIVADPDGNLVVLNEVDGFAFDPSSGISSASYNEPYLSTARLLAKIHQSVLPVGAPLSPQPLPPLAPAWVDLVDGAPVAILELLHVLQGDELLCEAYNQARLLTGARGLVHGDLKPENLILSKKGAVVFIDWENAGLGNQHWDIASIVGSILLGWLVRVRDYGRVDYDKKADEFQIVREQINSFLFEYGRARGGVVSINRSEVIILLCAWLIVRSLSYAFPQSQFGGHSALLLIAARGILLKPSELFDDLPQ